VHINFHPQTAASSRKVQHRLSICFRCFVAFCILFISHFYLTSANRLPPSLIFFRSDHAPHFVEARQWQKKLPTDSSNPKQNEFICERTEPSGKEGHWAFWGEG